TLSVALRSLILLHVIDQNFQPTVDASVVEVESEAPNLDRFAAAFVLPGVDARVERVEDLIVTGKERVLIDRIVAPIDTRVEGRSLDHHAVMDRRNAVLDLDPEVFSILGRVDGPFLGNDVPAFDPQSKRAGGRRDSKNAVRITDGLLFACRRADAQ